MQIQLGHYINEVWSMHVIGDMLDCGLAIRPFNVLHDFNREGLPIEIDFRRRLSK